MYRRMTFAALALTLGVLCLSTKASAISAFSRQYNVECSTCHDAIPHRNEFGEAFLRNGYVWPGAAHMKERPEGVKESLWLAGIVDSIPLSLSLRHESLYDEDNKEDKYSPDTRLMLHAGGNIKGYVGFFAHDVTSENAEAVVVVRFNELLGTPLNVRVGRLIPQTGLWKPNQSFFMTPTPSQAVTVAGEPALGAPKDGAEANWTVLNRMQFTLGAVDRIGQNPMDYYGRVVVKFGSYDLMGNDPETDFDHESIWDYLGVTLGVYGYKGWTESVDDDFHRVGVDAEVRYKGFTVVGGYLYGWDSDDADGLSVTTVAWTGEANYAFSPSHLVGIRYDHEDRGNSIDGKVNRVSAGYTFTPLQNLLVRIEGRWSKSEAEEDDESTVAGLLLTYHL